MNQPFLVIPAKAGIQRAASAAQKDLSRAYGALLDPRLRGDEMVLEYVLETPKL